MQKKCITQNVYKFKHIVYLVYIYEVYILQYTFGTKVYTKSTHFWTLFVQYMSYLSALCDLCILYTFIYFLYSINVAYVNLEQNSIHRASDISWKKKQNFGGFSGANSRKNRLISRDFCGKKVEIRRKIGRFHGRKVKVRRKIGLLRGILAEKSQISKDIQRQILRKIGRFHWKFRGETSPRNNQ